MLKQTVALVRKQHWLALSLATLGLLILVLGLFVASSAGPILEISALEGTRTPRPAGTPVVVRERNFGAWSYRAVRGERLYARVSFDLQTVSGLRAYADANRVLANQLSQRGERIEVQVTFRAPLTPEQFRTWVARHGMNVEVAGVRFIDGNGLRGALSISPEGDELLPQDVLDAPQNNIPGTQTEGVMNVRGSVEASQLPSVAADGYVFIADCTRAAIIEDLTAAGVPDATAFEIRVRSPSWEMEDLGLENFRTP
jgi:hypothetical protein